MNKSDEDKTDPRVPNFMYPRKPYHSPYNTLLLTSVSTVSAGLAIPHSTACTTDSYLIATHG